MKFLQKQFQQLENEKENDRKEIQQLIQHGEELHSIAANNMNVC
jgi:hypothetical protein